MCVRCCVRLQDSSGYLDRKELDSFIRDLIQQKSGVSRIICIATANSRIILYIFRLRNDLYCVEWGVKLYSLTHSLYST